MKKYPGVFLTYFDLKNHELTRKLAEDLYASSSSISLKLMIGKYPAFIVYCDELLAELQKIRTLNQAICSISDSLPGVALRQFIRQAMIEEIHQNNEMENIHSTRKEIQDEIRVIQNGKKGKRFDGMIRKYELLLAHKSIAMSSCQDIRNLYDSFVLEEVKKEDPSDVPDGLYFRKKPVSVARNNTIIHEGVYPESVLNETMEHALAFLNNNDYDPLIRIAAFHYLFGYIHPFYNGNGRMTRFISSYCLSAEHIHLLVSLRLSFVIKSHRAQYYKMFKNTNDHRNYADMTRFVVEFLGFVREAGEQVFSYLSEKKELLDHYAEIIHNLNLDQDTEKLLYILVQASICEDTSLITVELEIITKMSYYLLKKHLADIEPWLIISKSGKYQAYRVDLQKLDESENNGTLVDQPATSKRIGIAKGRFKAPADFDANNEEAAAMLMEGNL